MGFWSNLKERSYAFAHVDVSAASFPVDAWTDARYAEWFAFREKFGAEGGATCWTMLAGSSCDAGERTSFNSQGEEEAPLFSLVVPLYRTPRNYLEDLLNSLLGQTYEHFELVLVNASPADEGLCTALDSYCDLDKRVRVHRLESNRGITENTYEGIAQARGEFVCFIDHDDFLEPVTLERYAKAIDADGEIDVLYCDEDMVEWSRGSFVHKHPLLKPAFSPELLLCKNYVMHFLCVRRAILNELPAPGRKMDGCQDYDMVLKVVERARKVGHIPEVLYHWRISETSTATNPDSKPYSKRSNRLAIRSHIERADLPAAVVSSGIENLHNLWFFPGKGESISVVAVCSDAMEAQLFCESFVQVNSYGNCDLILCLPEGCEWEEGGFDLQTTVVFGEEDESVACAFNRGAAVASGSYLLFCEGALAFITPEPLEQLLGLCVREGVGAVAPKTLYADGLCRCFGIAVTSERIMPLHRGYSDEFPGYLCNARAFQNMSAVSRQGMMTRRAVFEAVGGFDELFEGEIGTADYCKRLSDLGYRVVQTPTVKAVAAEKLDGDRYGAAAGERDFSAVDLARFDKKWPGARAAGDPFFNGNLDQSSRYYQVKRMENR